jgi:hypothetical protein
MNKLASLLALAVLALPAPALADTGLAGSYKVQGWNPGTATSAKANYSGTLTLTEVGGDGVAAVWTVGDPASTTKGLGIVSNVGGKRLLSIGYNDGETGGIAVYEVSADGKTLTGVWGSGGAGHELNRR